VSIVRYRQGLEQVEDGVSQVDNVASAVKETKDQYAELDDSWTQWETANKDAKEIIDTEAEVVKGLSETVADPELEHFVRDNSDD
jgi:methyl-accepting chemotaxis protein